MAGTLRCPENSIPVRLPPLPYKSDTRNWEFPKTTAKESFTVPEKKKPIVTREGRFEQFIWHEMYYEYQRAVEQSKDTGKEPQITEYKDCFGKPECMEVNAVQTEKMINLISQYPVYGSEAISYWNPKGRQPNQFKKIYQITRPVQLQETQFG